MIVEIRGVQFVNQGAQLMLLAVLERLQARRPDVTVALAPGPGSPYAARARLGAWQKLPLRKGRVDLSGLGYRWPRVLDRALARYGIVTEAGVDAVLDASGFAYGDRWGGVTLGQVAAELTRFGRHGKPYLFLPQAFGPFTPGRDASRFGRALRHAALVCPRDATSAGHLATLDAGVGDALWPCPDLTLGVRGESAAAVRWRVDAGCALVIPNVRMLDSGPDAARWQPQYLALLEALAGECRRRGLRVMVVNHAGHEDAALCEALARAAGGLAIVDEADALALKGLIGAAGMVISSRFHGCVNALSQGVPCLGTSWSHKYGALFADFRLERWLVTEPDAPRAVALLGELLDAGPGERREAAARREQLLARVEALWERVFSLLPGGAER